METIELPKYGISESTFTSHKAYTVKENTLKEGLLVELVLCEVYSEDAANQIVAALEQGTLQLPSHYEVNR